MIQRSEDSITIERLAQIEAIQTAARDAVREALRRHMLLGESVVVADDAGDGSGAKVLTPEEVRDALRSA